MNGKIPLIATLIPALIFFSVAQAAHAGGTDLLKSPAPFVQTGADNSLSPGVKLFKSRRSRKGDDYLTTKSELVNIHAHSGKSNLRSLRNYTYSGRMRITKDTGGIGVTFNSNYPDSDEYYRLRRYDTNTFHIAPHGTSITEGTTDTGVVPKKRRWYRFKIRVNSDSSRTRIRAKVWPAKKREPRQWQVDCIDDSETRFTSGKVGVWSMAEGRKFWRELRVSR